MCPILVFLCWRVSWYMRIIHIIYHVYHVLLPDNINLASTNYIVLNSTDKACKLLYFIGNKTWPLHTLLLLTPPPSVSLSPLSLLPLLPFFTLILTFLPYLFTTLFFTLILTPLFPSLPLSSFPLPLLPLLHIFTLLFFTLTLTSPPSLLYPYPYSPSFSFSPFFLLPSFFLSLPLTLLPLLPFFTLNFTPPSLSPIPEVYSVMMCNAIYFIRTSNLIVYTMTQPG